MDFLVALIIIGIAWWLIVTAKVSLWFLLGVVALVALGVYIWRNVSPGPWR